MFYIRTGRELELYPSRLEKAYACALSKPPTYYIPCTPPSTIVTLRFGPSGGLQTHWSERGFSLMLNISSDSLIESRTIVTSQVASLSPAAKQHSDGGSTSLLPVHKKVQNRSHTHTHTHTHTHVRAPQRSYNTKLHT